MVTAISLAIVLSYLLVFNKADKRKHSSKEMEQYKVDTGCYLIDF